MEIQIKLPGRVHIRPDNPEDDVLAKAIGAGLRAWAESQGINSPSSAASPTNNDPPAPASSETPQSQ